MFRGIEIAALSSWFRSPALPLGSKLHHLLTQGDKLDGLLIDVGHLEIERRHPRAPFGNGPGNGPGPGPGGMRRWALTIMTNCHPAPAIYRNGLRDEHPLERSARRCRRAA